MWSVVWWYLEEQDRKLHGHGRELSLFSRYGSNFFMHQSLVEVHSDTMYRQFLLNPVTQDEKALRGFEEICRMLICSKVIERRFREDQQRYLLPDPSVYLMVLFKSAHQGFPENQCFNALHNLQNKLYIHHSCTACPRFGI